MRKVTTLTGRPDSRPISSYVSDRVFDGIRKVSPGDAERLKRIYLERKSKVVADFTRVCDQTGLSEKLRKD